MKKGTKFLAALLVLPLAACGAGLGSPIPGNLFSDVRAPGLGIGEASDYKEGRAECESILGLIATGDCSIEAAKRNGGITQVQYVDRKVKNILGVYATYTTIVKGS